MIYEDGGAAANAGVQLHPVDDDDGTISPAAVQWAIAAAAHHHPRPGAVCIENTHMPSGGVPWPLGALEEIVRVADGLAVHMDGARLFNAEIATGVDAARFAAPVTTVMSCLSKGLCAPVGSLLAGPADVVEQARARAPPLGRGHAPGRGHRRRGAGGVADHGRPAGRRPRPGPASGRGGGRPVARRGLRPGPGADQHRRLRPRPTPDRVIEHLRAEGILAGTIAPGVLRLVTHHDVDDAGIERAVKAVAGAP